MSINCDLVSVEALTTTIYKVVIKPHAMVSFNAGQYLLVLLGEKDKRAFSIANCPALAASGLLELHIGAADHNPYALEVVENAKKILVDPQIDFLIDAPFGDAFLREDSNRPVILIAGGTGYSYARSILEQLLTKHPDRLVYFYWGGKNLTQLYDLAMLRKWEEKSPNLLFIPVVEETDDANWQGRINNVLAAVMEDFVSLNAYDIYLAGRFDMAGAAREMFTQERGADIKHIYADAFSFL